MKISDIYSEFRTSVNNYKQCIIFAAKIDVANNDSNVLVKELIINNAFINVVNAWEKFLEKSVVAYSMGEKSLNGNCPTCYILPKDDEHALQLIKGEVQYFDWSTRDKIVQMSERVFENGEPYKTTLNSINSILLQIKKLRNNIAHDSNKSNNEFDTLVRNELSPSCIGITTAQFLLVNKGKEKPFWEKYFIYLENAVDSIAKY